MIVTISKSKITRMKMLYDAKGKTMEQWHRDYGFSYAVNTVLFELGRNQNGEFDLCGILDIDGKRLCDAALDYGFGIKNNVLVFSYDNLAGCPDFAAFAYSVLVRDGEIEVTQAESDKRGLQWRSAVGINEAGDIILFCQHANRSLMGIARDMQAAGCTVAGNYDGGGSSNLWTPDKQLLTTRPLPAILAIWTGEPEDKPDNDKEESAVSNQKIVCLDPGHGSTCANGSPDGTYKEDEFNLDVANRIRAILERHGVKVVMTRTDGTDVSLSQRAVISNNAKADLFLSIHTNASGDGKTWTGPAGWEAFVSEKGYTAEKLAEAIRKVTIPATAVPDRGVKEANYVVLLATTAPAVLVEHGFHTNEAEVEKLKDSDYRQLLAECDAQGVLSTLGIAYAPGTSAAPQKPWYQDACDWVKANGIADGTRPTDPATRAEVFTMLMRLENKRKGES